MQRVTYSWLLSIIIPGAGHLLWKDRLFGIFVFLVMLLGVGLAYVGVFLGADSYFYWGLVILPVVFFVVAMIDLKRTIKKKQKEWQPSARTGLIYLVAALLIHFSVPGMPGRYVLDNFPAVTPIDTDGLSPVVEKGSLALVNPNAYYTKLFFYQRPIFHALPARFDPVRGQDGNGQEVIGVVVGLPEEQIEAVEGFFTINGVPLMSRSVIPIGGDCPLTTVGTYSILVAELRLGRIAAVHEVSLFDLDGKISPLL